MTTRPARNEAAEYYFTYIDKVPDGDILATLEMQQDEMLELLSGITEDDSLRRYAEGKWTLRETIGHLNDAERLFVFRAMWFARGFAEPLPSFDQNVAVEIAKANDLPWARHIDEFRAVREASRAFFENLPEDAWTRRGTASGYEFTVRALAFMVAGHGIHHAKIIRERYLSASGA